MARNDTMDVTSVISIDEAPETSAFDHEETAAFEDGNSADEGTTTSESAVSERFNVDGAKTDATSDRKNGAAAKRTRSDETGAETPAPKKTRIRQPPPGRADGPSVKFSKECRRLTSASAKGRNKPRLIDMTHFPENVNLERAAMADFVTTILYHHNPDTLNQFMDDGMTRKFEFVVKDRTGKKPPFAITTEHVAGVTEVHVGYYNLPENANLRNNNVQWDEQYVYKIDEQGKWRSDRLDEQTRTVTRQKSVLESKAADFGRQCLLERVWSDNGERFAIRVNLS